MRYAPFCINSSDFLLSKYTLVGDFKVKLFLINEKMIMPSNQIIIFKKN